MKYSSIVLLTTLAVSGMAVAEDSNNTNTGSNAGSDDNFECIVDFIAADLDQSQHDKYIEECVQKKQAKKQQENSKKQG